MPMEVMQKQGSTKRFNEQLLTQRPRAVKATKCETE